MNAIAFELPWMLIAAVAGLALYGLWDLGRRLARIIRAVREMNRKSALETPAGGDLTDRDRRAREAIGRKTREVWRSYTIIHMLDFAEARNECHGLIREVAAAYYPDSENPELEVTVFELLKLNKRITINVIELLEPFTTLHKISVSSLLDAKTLFEQTRNVIDRKGVRTGGRIAGRVWQALNAMNPQYWLGRAIFRGATELAGRKAITSIYRIVGQEAMNIYRSSSAAHIDPESLIRGERDPEKSGTAGNGPGMEDIQPPAAGAPPAGGEEKTQPDAPGHQSAKPDNPDTANSTPSAAGNPENALAAAVAADGGGKTPEPEIIFPEDAEEPKGEDPKKPGDLRARMYRMIAETFNQFLAGGLQLWEKLANPQTIIERYKKEGHTVESLDDIRSLSPAETEAAARHYMKRGEWLGAAEGAAAGFGGLLLIPADAVSLIALQLRTIQQIGYCYGFDLSRPEEKMFAAKLLAEAYSHPSNKERGRIMSEMRNAAKLLRGGTPLGALHQRFFVQGLAKVGERIGIRLGTRKTAQFLPVLGAAVGGYLNKRVMRDIAEVANEVYLDRFKAMKERQ